MGFVGAGSGGRGGRCVLLVKARIGGESFLHLSVVAGDNSKTSADMMVPHMMISLLPAGA
jgi:hypothetical protein